MKPPLRRPRVLLVDDDASARTALADLLDDMGLEVATANDGLDALSRLERFAPDVVITDLSMPGLDGYELIVRLRARTGTSGIPIIVVSADEDNPPGRIRSLGADDFLPKPIDVDVMLTRLDEHLPAIVSRRRS